MKLFALPVIVLTISLLSFGQSNSSVNSVSSKKDITPEMIKILSGTSWIGRSGIFFKENHANGITVRSVMVFSSLGDKLYYLSDINPVIDRLIDIRAGGLCVKSEPRRVEFFQDMETKFVSAIVSVPSFNNAGQTVYKKIVLDEVTLDAAVLKLDILSYDYASDGQKMHPLPTKYYLNRVDVDALPRRWSDMVKPLRVKLDDCIRTQPWLN